MKKKYGILDNNQKFTLTHCLMIASERFTEDVKELHKEADRLEKAATKAKKKGIEPQFAWATPTGLRRAAKQLEQQAEDARQLRQLLEDSGAVMLKDPSEEADEALEVTDRV